MCVCVCVCVCVCNLMCVHVRNVRMVAAGKQHTPPLCAATKERLLLFGSFFCGIKAADVSR